MAKHFFIFSTICFSSFVLLGGATGTGSAQARENYNYSTSMAKTKRYVQDGKDSNDDSNNNNNNNINGEEREEKTAGPTIATEVEDSASHLQMHFIEPSRTLNELNIVKRAPNGFTGMRGKKQSEYTDFTRNAFDWNPPGWADNSEQQQDVADSMWTTLNGRRFKKAPSAFYGVRGKKFADGGNNYYFGEIMHKLDEELFREQQLQDFLNQVAIPSEYMNEIEKRTPSGFMGMRGKREMNANDSDDDDDERDFVKRSPGNSAFVGVRGKKDMLHQTFKRSPPQQMSFYGTRGKKQPFVDFRNKFVGVRGKKNYAAAATSQSVLPNTDPNNMLMSETETEREQTFGTQPRYLVDMLPMFFRESVKRTPSGFLGMRGKRSANDGVTTVQNNNDFALF